MQAPVRFAPCWNVHNPKAAITDGQGYVVAFATAATPEQAEQNASFIVAALNHYIAAVSPQLFTQSPPGLFLQR